MFGMTEKTELAARIAAAREQKGMTQEQVADHFGISRVSVTNWESGQTKPAADKLSALERLLQVEPGHFSGATSSNKGRNGRAPQSEASPADAHLPPRTAMANDVPVMGTAAGSHTKGAFQFSSTPIDYVRRPPALTNAKDIYALYVEGQSMEPEFRPGQLIYVHAHKPPRFGDAVIIQTQVAEGEFEATIGIYAKKTAEAVFIEKHNPKATIQITRSIVVAVHKVLTTNELFGV